MTDIATILSSIDIPTLIAIITSGGIGSFLRGWWNKKTAAQKKAAFNDFVNVVKDRKVTANEVTEYVDEHF